MEKRTFGLIGNGSWATAIAKIITDNGQKIHWWMRGDDAVQHIKDKHQNMSYLSSVKFNIQSLDVTTDIEKVFTSCDDIIICVPSAYLLDVIDPLPNSLFQNKRIISAVKGLLPEHFMLLNDYLHLHKGLDVDKNYACITGPCHAEEVAQEKLSYLTFSSRNTLFAEDLSSIFKNSYLNTISNHDIVGTQYASILKNIYAVGAGMIHGMGYGDNFMSVYITNCFREMMSYFECHELADKNSIHKNINSAYLGDLLVTCYSLHSRNRRFGHLLGQSYSIKNAILEMGMMAEGYFASKGMYNILKRENQQMPIVQSIYEILWENSPIKSRFKTIESLLV